MGTLPPSIGNCSKLQSLGNFIIIFINFLTIFLELYSNSLSGVLPSSLNKISPQNFDISFNRFSGKIPPFIGLWPLGSLYLNNNRFTGYIPNEFSIFVGNFFSLKLNNNFLSGPIPTFFCSNQLQNLDVYSNNFSCLPR